MPTSERTDELTVLVLATQDWPLAAFLAIALRRGGFAVAGLCPSRHALRHTDAVDRCFHFSLPQAARSLRGAIRRANPTILVPCDDQSVYAIYELYQQCRQGGAADASEIMRLIEDSLGNPESFPIARDKSAFIRVARECDVRIPDTYELDGAAALKAHCDTAQPPFVLKQDGTFGGLGVIVAHSKAEAEKALKRLKVRAAVNAGRALLLKFNHRPLLAWLRDPPPVISVQQYIEGRPANRAVLCWHGRVLAGTTVMTLEADPFPNGPASVVEFIREAEIEQAVERLVARLGLSGFCGFDFMLDEKSGRPFLLELNPRATSACWLGTRPRSDLAAALYRALSDESDEAAGAGSPTPGEDEEAPGEKVALFPQEWMRANTSPHLATSYHRVPWQDPRLVAYLARDAWKSRRASPGYLARLARRLVLGKDWQLRSDMRKKGEPRGDNKAWGASDGPMAHGGN